MMGWLADETGLEKCAANHVPLTPLSHLRARRMSLPTAPRWCGRDPPELCRLCRAGQPAGLGAGGPGVRPGDVVATLLPNIPAQAEAHFGVPACGAVLNTINTRLDADTVAYIFGHAGAKVVLCDTAFLALAEAAMDRMEGPARDDRGGGPRLCRLSGRYLTYEDLLDSGDPGAPWIMPGDEWESIAINYTSAPPGGPRAWSITIAAPIWRPPPMRSAGG
jgi:fatty-acyl-CoA synthase